MLQQCEESSMHIYPSADNFRSSKDLEEQEKLINKYMADLILPWLAMAVPSCHFITVQCMLIQLALHRC